MNRNKQENCEPCTKEAAPLDASELAEVIKTLPNWEIKRVDSIDRLVRTFDFKNFKEALEFTNRVGEIAEEQNHHPAILTEWGKVTVSWWTHTIKGLHKNDFIMAGKTSELHSKSK